MHAVHVTVHVAADDIHTHWVVAEAARLVALHIPGATPKAWVQIGNCLYTEDSPL